MIQISIRVLFKPNPQELPFIYRRLGKGQWALIFFIFIINLTRTLSFLLSVNHKQIMMSACFLQS